MSQFSEQQSAFENNADDFLEDGEYLDDSDCLTTGESIENTIRDILRRAAETDVEFETSLRYFEEAFSGNIVLRDELLRWLARLDPHGFYQSNGPAILKWILQNRPELLSTKTSYGEELSPLHDAIAAFNVDFLDCLMDISDETGISINRALEMVNGRKHNCLHAAIANRLPCAARMVLKCSEDALTMVDYRWNNPLHLAMAFGRKIYPPSRQRRKINNDRAPSNESKPETSDNHRQRALPSNSNARVFDPAYILEAIKNLAAMNSTDGLMAKVLTATNRDGLTPYQLRLRVFENPTGKEVEKGRENIIRNEKQKEKQKDGQKEKQKEKHNEKKFQDYFKNLIFDSLTDVSDIGKALYGNKKPERELFLDMLNFNQSYDDFKLFIDQFTRHSADTLFEEILVYVYLPDLNTFEKECPHDWVRDFFSWLADKGVKKIKTLNVPDSIATPMADELVEEAILNQFQIQRFHWRRLDVNLDILTGSNTADHLMETSLYSSGNWSVLYHWASEDGLAKLQNLRRVRIEIMELDLRHDTIARQRHNILAASYTQMLEEKLEDIKKKKMVQQGRKFEYELAVNVKWGFSILQPPEDDESFPSLKLLEQLKKCHTFLRNLERSHGPQNRAYAQRFKDLIAGPDSRPAGPDLRIKVAIIDNGADKMRSTLKNNIADGYSFITADSDSETGNRTLPWYMVADPHGTQMASLIKKSNPFVSLYIARVGTGRKDIVPENAAKAVEWAIEQKVDIISISWITKQHDQRLESAIQHAVRGSSTHHPILVFCSTADEGVYSGKIYPADYNGTVSVAATDKYGRIRPASQPGVDILVPGENIEAEGPSYMGQFVKGMVSGSSVATALAAGIASLALLLLRTFNEAEFSALKRFFEKEGMLKVFGKMNSEVNGIQLFDLFPDDASQLPDAWKVFNF